MPFVKWSSICRTLTKGISFLCFYSFKKCLLSKYNITVLSQGNTGRIIIKNVVQMLLHLT